MQLPLRLRVPASELTLLPIGPDDYAAALDLFVVLLDSHGNRSDVPSVAIDYRSAGPARDDEWLDYTVRVRMRTRTQRAIVALYDLNGETLWSSAIEIEP